MSSGTVRAGSILSVTVITWVAVVVLLLVSVAVQVTIVLPIG